MTWRVQRINEVIKEELSKIILREIDFPDNTLVTITRVDTTSNLIKTKVYVSTLPDKNAEKVLKILNSRVYFLQKTINKKLRMRPVPQIEFKEEVKTKEAGEIEELLEKIKKTNG